MAQIPLVLRLAALLAVMTGCVTEPHQRMVVGPGGSSFEGTRSAASALEEAQQMIESGQHQLAVPRLLHIMAKFPKSSEAIEARYWLGLAYYQTTSYQDAIVSFDEYVELAPSGPHAEEAARYADALRAEYAEKYLSADELDEQIEAAKAVVQEEPNNLQARLKLADLLWQRGDYQAAGTIYTEALRNNPDLISNNTIAERMERMPTGEYLVLTPAEIERRSIEDRPILITNTNYFRSGEDLITREARFYVVTGQTYNRSDSVLYGVQVHVTIYGFGNVIYDTATINVGRLNPGERRAFSVRFSNFDNINNVARYECIATYER